MINFFRNKRKEMADYNKPLKYMRYAIGEILLIFIGVLIALQISDFSEKNKIRSAEQLLLKSLLSEMKANHEQLNEAMLYHSKSRKAAKRMLEIYNGDYIYKNYQEVDSTLAELQWAWTFDPSMGALNSIKMSGHLNSVQNADLRTLITTYEDLSNDAKEEGKIIQDIIIDKYIPGVNKYISLNQRVKYLGEKYTVGTSNFKSDYEGLFKDRSVESIITYIHTWRIDEFDEEEKLNRMMEKFISTLDKEIKK
jgi:hypothetical protein